MRQLCNRVLYERFDGSLNQSYFLSLNLCARMDSKYQDRTGVLQIFQVQLPRGAEYITECTKMISLSVEMTFSFERRVRKHGAIKVPCLALCRARKLDLKLMYI